MVGAAIVRALAGTGCDILPLGRDQADLRDQQAVRGWFAEHRPQLVFLAAAKVGGIVANDSYPADFLYDNLMIEANIIEASHRHDVEKLLFLGSSCIYPKLAEQPMREDALLTGPLEPTNQWYAIAKIAGIKLAEAYRAQHGRNFISGMPTNLYGPGDNFDLTSSHVLPALARKIVEARDTGAAEVPIWGTGTPLREFLHVDDCASACLFLMAHYDGAEHVNIGSGAEISIAGLAQTIARIAGYQGRFVFDSSKPDGTPRKLMDSSRLHALGWQPTISLDTGIAQVVGIIEQSAGQLRTLDLAASH
ncbi:MAG: GDP-L-fucose synthase [Sphingomonas sp.]|nr:GDP-L-fucose synthase [Sphingomonas sp.]